MARPSPWEVEVKAPAVLAVVLRICGIFMVLAFLAVFLPYDWMNQINGWLGLGTLPDLPIVDYLTRSLSAFYGMYGVLIVYLSRDVRRYLGVIGLLAWLGMVFACLVFGIDLLGGMPRYWAWSEGPFVFLVSAWTLWLVRRCRHQRHGD